MLMCLLACVYVLVCVCVCLHMCFLFVYLYVYCLFTCFCSKRRTLVQMKGSSKIGSIRYDYGLYASLTSV